MKACKHYRLFGKETYIEMSGGHMWNGWVKVYDEDGRLYYNSFQSGVVWEYLEHLLENRKCRREAGMTKKEVQRLLKDIKREWKEVTDP